MEEAYSEVGAHTEYSGSCFYKPWDCSFGVQQGRENRPSEEDWTKKWTGSSKPTAKSEMRSIRRHEYQRLTHKPLHSNNKIIKAAGNTLTVPVLGATTNS